MNGPCSYSDEYDEGCLNCMYIGNFFIPMIRISEGKYAINFVAMENYSGGADDINSHSRN